MNALKDNVQRNLQYSMTAYIQHNLLMHSKIPSVWGVEAGYRWSERVVLSADPLIINGRRYCWNWPGISEFWWRSSEFSGSGYLLYYISLSVVMVTAWGPWPRSPQPSRRDRWSTRKMSICFLPLWKCGAPKNKMFFIEIQPILGLYEFELLLKHILCPRN